MINGPEQAWARGPGPVPTNIGSRGRRVGLPTSIWLRNQPSGRQIRIRDRPPAQNFAANPAAVAVWPGTVHFFSRIFAGGGIPIRDFSANPDQAAEFDPPGQAGPRGGPGGPKGGPMGPMGPMGPGPMLTYVTLRGPWALSGPACRGQPSCASLKCLAQALQSRAQVPRSVTYVNGV